MSNPEREQLPLLCDELSDDDYNIEDCSTAYKRRLSPNAARYKYQVKGAAAIIKHWPDHVSSLLTYWWMGLAMIGLTVFIIYNSVVAIAILPPPSKLNGMTPSKLQDMTVKYFPPYKNIYMHLITNDNLTTELKDYMPYVEIISKQFPTFKYNFIILYNDTLENIDDSVSDFQKNKLALSALWKNKNDFTQVVNTENIFIQRRSLTTYMNGSPIKKYWRHLPDKFINFLIRCIAIWNKGGISINPLLLTPRSPNPHYVDKIKGLLKNIDDPKMVKKQNHIVKPKAKKYKKKVNNIRDIIENLKYTSASNEDKANDISLDKEETKNFPMKINVTNTQISKNGVMIKDKHKKHVVHKSPYKDIDSNYSEKMNAQDFITVTTDSYLKDIHKISTNETTEQRLLPMFIKYLFSPTTEGNVIHQTKSDRTVSELVTQTNRIDEDIVPKNKMELGIHTKFAEKDRSKEIKNSITSSEEDQALDLTLDLKGNMIASTTPCHALLGTIFNNAIHHIRDETVTDFIIAELSFFCKGTWTYCKGVNVIF